MAEIATDWRAALPDDLKTAPALQDVKDIPGLAKAFIDTKALVGGSLRPPGPDATPEVRLEFINKLKEKVPELVLIPDGEDDAAKLARDAAMARLGRPKEAKEYTAPKDVDLPADVLEALQKDALDEGLTKSQFQVRAKKEATKVLGLAQLQREAQAALKKELGAAFEERTASAAAVAAKLGARDDLVAALKTGAVDAGTFRMFAQIAKGFGETRVVADQTGAVSGKPTPAEDKATRAEIMARPEYFNPKPNQLDVHRALVAKVADINERLAQVEA